jgi:hypothetical protein
MKVCPKCNSSYSDETLNFCLTDGVPLVAEEGLDEFLSKQNSNLWHTADTLVDQRFLSADARPTLNNPSSPTFEMGNTTAQSLTTPKSRKSLYTILGILLGVIVVGGGIWWFSKPANPANKNVLSEDTASVPKHAIVPISPEQDAQIKKELTAFMQSWAKTNEQKDADAHLAHYANTLEIFYTESNKDKNHVLADRLRAYQKYDTISMQVDNLKITPESLESATIVFDKSWTMKNDKKTSTGSVQQEVHVTKTNGKWLIDSEKDIKVYFINNRENQSSDNSNQSNPESKSVSQPPTTSDKTADLEKSVSPENKK